MFVLPAFAALAASFGWAVGIVLAQSPARAVGAFEFTRIQLIACSAILSAACAVLGYWTTVVWDQWLAFATSIGLGILLGNLAMIECLRRGGPRRTELLLALKAPLVAVMAYVWLGETVSLAGMIGGAIILSGIVLAIFFADSPADDVDGNLAVVIALGVVAAASQGAGYLLVKPAMLAGTEPLAVSAVRLTGAAFLISLIGLWPFSAFRPGAEMTPYLLFRIVLPGFIGYGVSSSLLLYAFANFSAGMAAILGSLSPVLVLPLISLRTGVLPHGLAWTGAVLAIAGTALMILL
ncbi:EamA family transporter [Anderseniella sp. Alg231-50]|uniref:EamA family transporter n=1 Tax=Anderseniella sp. Alg231-50 TaxID=1922226 RepID=UPI000D56287C